MIEQIQWWWRGGCPYGEPDPEAPKALSEAQKSLYRAQRVSTVVNKVVKSVQAEGDKNHFIDLLYSIKN